MSLEFTAHAKAFKRVSSLPELTAQAGANTAPGSVFVFNVFSEDMDQFSANGRQVGVDPSIPAWSSGPTPPKYTPFSLRVPRTLNKSDGPGKFFNGTNTIIVSWSGEGGSLNVTINGANDPLLEDLALYVFRRNFHLLNSVGEVIQSGTIASIAI